MMSISKLNQDNLIQSIDEQEEFKQTFNVIMDTLLADNNEPELSDLLVWTQELYEYNVINGKQLRGLLVVKAIKLMAKMMGNEITEEDIFIWNVLGWAVEIFQACALILDDIMDESETRRGRICWYKKTGMGAINDGLLLEQHCYYLIKLFFSEKAYYTKIVDLSHEAALLSVKGQFLDLKTECRDRSDNYKNFTNSRLETIYKYKTSFYSFVFPIKLALVINSIETEEEHSISEAILLKIGHLFQMQDDFIDCFGDPSVTGKIGTDILDGKCCWPIVTAFQLCDERQREVLNSNYGIKCEENVNAVKQIYEELNLIHVFHSKSTQMYDNICDEIQKLNNNHKLCPELYQYTLDKIYQRDK